MRILSTSVIIGLLAFISACSSSSGSSPADITSANANDLSIAATESTKQAVTTTSANFYLKSGTNQSPTDFVTNKIREIVFEAQSLGIICTGGGSYNDNISGTQTSASGSITFSNCDVGNGIIIDGSVTFSGSQTSFTITYNNLTITGFGETNTVNATITCTSTNSSFSCSTNTSITGIDGRTYAVSNISVSGSSFSGYNVSATVTDPTHGTISINATNVTFNCTSPNAGRPDSGSITFSSNGKSGTVTFDSCSSYTVTVDGVSNSYTW